MSPSFSLSSLFVCSPPSSSSSSSFLCSFLVLVFLPLNHFFLILLFFPSFSLFSHAEFTALGQSWDAVSLPSRAMLKLTVPSTYIGSVLYIDFTCVNVTTCNAWLSLGASPGEALDNQLSASTVILPSNNASNTFVYPRAGDWFLMVEASDWWKIEARTDNCLNNCAWHGNCYLDGRSSYMIGYCSCFDGYWGKRLRQRERLSMFLCVFVSRS